MYKTLAAPSEPVLKSLGGIGNPRAKTPRLLKTLLLVKLTHPFEKLIPTTTSKQSYFLKLMPMVTHTKFT